jgi:hypothetical protein
MTPQVLIESPLRSTFHLQTRQRQLTIILNSTLYTTADITPASAGLIYSMLVPLTSLMEPNSVN